jgi:hypothetical protein
MVYFSFSLTNIELDLVKIQVLNKKMAILKKAVLDLREEK